jgi:hypothetical protein
MEPVSQLGPHNGIAALSFILMLALTVCAVGWSAICQLQRDASDEENAKLQRLVFDALDALNTNTNAADLHARMSARLAALFTSGHATVVAKSRAVVDEALRGVA